MSELDLVWEAEHPEEAGFCGGWVEPGDGRAFLSYGGEVKRKGALVWQKNHLESPAEIVAISLAADEPLWSTELGKETDLEPLVGDQVFRALRPRVLGQAGTALMVAVLFQPDVWDLYALHGESGEVLWTARVKEPFTHHIDFDNQWIWTCGEDGTVSARRAETGESMGQWPLELDEFQCLASPGSGFVYGDEERCLLALDPHNQEPKWRLDMEAVGIESITDRVVVKGQRVYVLESGRVRYVKLESGDEVFRKETHEGDQLFLTEAAGRLFVQDVLGGNLSPYNGETGEEIGEDSYSDLLYWGEFQERMVATSVDGKVLLQAPGMDELKPLDGVEDWKIVELADWNGALLGMAIKGEETPSFHLVQLPFQETETVEKIGDLTVAEGASLVVKDGHVIVGTAAGFQVFTR